MTTLGTRVEPAAGHRRRCDVVGVAILLAALGASVVTWAAVVIAALLLVG